MQSGQHVATNLATAERLVEQAAGQGASLVVLPELFACLGSYASVVASAESIPGPTSGRLASLSARLSITLVAGSIAEVAEPGKAYNTSLVFGPDGTLLSAYRKIHLFDLDLPSVTSRESSFIAPGSEVCVARSPLGPLGLAICYDLRFPELFRLLVDRGAQLIAIPSAFTRATGKDHWEILIRARAIENQAYVLAANQWGEHPPDMHSFGHSAIIGPWGDVLAQLDEGEAVALAEIDVEHLLLARRRLPALSHRKPLK